MKIEVDGLQLTVERIEKTTEEATRAAVPEGTAGVVVKSEDERRYTLCVAYPADKPDIGVAADGHRDFASKKAVEDAAWYYMTKARTVGLWHADGTDGAGETVESYIYRGPDWVIEANDGSEQIVKAGDWLMGVVWSEETWPLVKQGLVGGLSPQGRARRRVPSDADVEKLRS